MKLISAIRLVALLCASVAVGACVGTAPSKELRLIDSLNQQAYAFRYKDIDSSCHAARGWILKKPKDTSGKSTA